MQQTGHQTEQQREQRQYGRPWLPGRSGNPTGRSRAVKLARRDALIAEWTKDIGGEGALSAVELDLVRKAAELMLLRATRAEDAVRIANSVSKILAQVGLIGGARKRDESSELAKLWREGNAP
jgi:hypothetical protein